MADVIYIMSDERSGSTMLDMMLAGHPEITSIGEAHQLKAYAKGDRAFYQSVHELVCMCGEKVEECAFWRAVADQMDRPLSDLDLKVFFLRKDFPGGSPNLWLKKAAWLLFQTSPRLYNLSALERAMGGKTVAEDSMALFDAVLRARKTRYVLDSSKSTFRLKSLIKHAPNRIKVIALYRDPRGVVNSKMKRGVPLRKASYHWKWVAHQMNLIAKEAPADSICRVKYEDLCTNLHDEMARILGFLGLAFDSAVLRRNHADVHHLGGSPSKYTGEESPIRLDDSYKQTLSERDQRQIQAITSTPAKELKY